MFALELCLYYTFRVIVQMLVVVVHRCHSLVGQLVVYLLWKKRYLAQFQLRGTLGPVSEVLGVLSNRKLSSTSVG